MIRLGLGTFDPQQKQVHVIGAGVSGLLVAYTLKKKGYQVQVHEASGRVGGLIHTRSSPFGMIETAAHSLLITPETKAFLTELGVELTPVQKGSKARYIFRNGKLRKIPLSLLEVFSTLLRFFSKPKVALNFAHASLEEWGNAYVGAAATQNLLNPFVSGIFAATPSELNAAFSFPKLIPSSPELSLFRFFRKKDPTKKKGPRPVMMALTQGTEFLIQQLKAHLSDNILYHSPVSSLDGLSGNIILTCPATETASLIKEIDPTSAHALAQVDYAPLITATLFLRDQDFIHSAPRGVGFLVPRSEKVRLLGCLFNSSAFPSRAKSGWNSLTIMIGGTSDREAVQLSDEAIHELIVKELTPILKIQPGAISPHHLFITHWPRAIPVYSTHLKETCDLIRAGYGSQPGRIIFSNFAAQISIRSMLEAMVQFSRQDL